MTGLKKFVCAAVMELLLVVPFAASAAEVQMSASADEVISVSGDLHISEAKQYIIMVLREGYEGAVTDSNFSDYVIAMEQGISEEDGTFVMDIPTSEAVTSGNYYIALTMAGSTAIDKVIPCYYLSVSERETILASINNAASAAALRDIIEEKHIFLNISFDGLYASVANAASVFEKIFYCRPFDSLPQMQQCFEESCVLQAIYECNTPAAVVACIEANNFYIKGDLTDLHGLSDPSAAGAWLMHKPYYAMDEFLAGLEEAVCVSAFNQGTRSEMVALIEKYAVQLQPSSAYISASSQSKQALYKGLEAEKHFDSYDEISTFISDWFRTVSSGSGGSGSSGGATGSIGSGTGSGLGAGIGKNVSTNTLSSASSLTPATRFTDLADVDWAIEAIEYLTNRRIVSGVSETEFEPSRNIAKEEFAKVLVEAFAIAEDGAQVDFPDVDYTQWYARYVRIAAESRIVYGDENGLFGIGTPLSRQDMAVMLHRTLEKTGYELNGTTEMPEFEDYEEIADYARAAVEDLCKAGAINGMGDGQFAPGEYTTRAMAAKVIYMLIKD